MCSMKWFVVVAGFLAVMAVNFSTVRAADPKQSVAQGQVAEQKQSGEQKQPQDQDRWRFTFHNGEWWYWLPTNRWVFWRDHRWNDFNPKTYTAPVSSGTAETRQNGTTSRDGTNGSDIRPFYGHAQSTLDRRPLEANNEVGPFYGHALPNEVFGPCGVSAISGRFTVMPSIQSAIERQRWIIGNRLSAHRLRSVRRGVVTS